MLNRIFNPKGLCVNFISVLVFLFLYLFGCKDPEIILNENQRVFSEFPVEDSINFKEVFDYKEGVPRKMFLLDSNLIICNYSAKYFIYCYSLNNKLSEGYLKKGRGPNETIGAFDCGIINGSLLVHDISLKKILTTNIAEILANKSSVLFKKYPVNDFYQQINFTDSIHFLAVGIPTTSSKISEVDLISGERINEFGKFSYIPPEIPLEGCKDAYYSLLFSRPSGGRFVLPYFNTDVIEIYNIKDKTCIAVQGPENIKADFKFRRNRRGIYFADITKNTRKAFIGGSVTDKYIYLLYSGELEMNGHGESSANSIYIYDWDGNPIKKLVLNKSASVISVSRDDKLIMAYGDATGYLLQASIN